MVDARKAELFYRALVDLRDAQRSVADHDTNYAATLGDNIIAREALKFAVETVRELLDGKFVAASTGTNAAPA